MDRMGIKFVARHLELGFWRRVNANLRLKNLIYSCICLPIDCLFEVSFCVTTTVIRHIHDKKTMFKIWLNPGTNLTIFRETGPRGIVTISYRADNQANGF